MFFLTFNALQMLRDSSDTFALIHVLNNTYYLTSHAARSVEFNRLGFIGLCFFRPISICKAFLGYTLKHLPSPLVTTYPLYWFHSPPHFISPVRFQKGKDWFREKSTGTGREQTRTSTKLTLLFRRCTATEIRPNLLPAFQQPRSRNVCTRYC